MIAALAALGLLLILSLLIAADTTVTGIVLAGSLLGFVPGLLLRAPRLSIALLLCLSAPLIVIGLLLLGTFLYGEFWYLIGVVLYGASIGAAVRDRLPTR
jgi:hypothetical protein